MTAMALCILLPRLLIFLALALGAASAPRAGQGGLSLVICGADGPYTLTLGDDAKPEKCCDCCLAAFAAAHPAAPVTLQERRLRLPAGTPERGGRDAASPRREGHPARGPPAFS